MTTPDKPTTPHIHRSHKQGIQLSPNDGAAYAAAVAAEDAAALNATRDADKYGHGGDPAGGNTGGDGGYIPAAPSKGVIAHQVSEYLKTHLPPSIGKDAVVGAIDLAVEAAAHLKEVVVGESEQDKAVEAQLKADAQPTKGWDPEYPETTTPRPAQVFPSAAKSHNPNYRQLSAGAGAAGVAGAQAATGPGYEGKAAWEKKYAQENRGFHKRTECLEPKALFRPSCF